MTNTVLMHKSELEKLAYIGEILSSGKSDSLYDEISNFLINDTNKYPHNYLLLIAEAVVSGIRLDQVKQDHPNAIRRAQEYISGMEEFMPRLLKETHAVMKEKLPLKFANSIEQCITDEAVIRKELREHFNKNKNSDTDTFNIFR